MKELQKLPMKRREEKAISDCRDKLKESLDDKYYLHHYDLDPYKNSFISSKEGQNDISSIMYCDGHSDSKRKFLSRGL
jgi:hypothetical protein